MQGRIPFRAKHLVRWIEQDDWLIIRPILTSRYLKGGRFAFSLSHLPKKCPLLVRTGYAIEAVLPSLFIIAEEVLSRGLSRFFSHNLAGYYRHGRGQIPITHSDFLFGQW
jgi:hypothetical protein